MKIKAKDNLRVATKALVSQNHQYRHMIMRPLIYEIQKDDTFDAKLTMFKDMGAGWIEPLEYEIILDGYECLIKSEYVEVIND